MHFIKQVVLIIRSEKKRSNAPVIIAPITLVAAKVTAKRTTDARIVPKTPVINTGRILQIHLLSPFSLSAGEIPKSNPKNTTAIPPVTHKKAGATAMVAVIVKIAVTKPIIILAKIASVIQRFLLHPQAKFVITSPPILVYAAKYGK